LDFLAEGILIILINRATKLFDRFQSLDKRYSASFRLGIVTETWDLEGSIIETKPVGHVTLSQLEAAALSLKGEIVQVPPVFSAKKISGKPAYYYARNDTGHEQLKRLKASNVSIYSIGIKSFDGLDGTMSVCCSSGTYVRSIVNEIGNILGCGATLTHLTRDSIGKFELSDSINADDIERIADNGEKNADCTKKNGTDAGENANSAGENANSAEKEVSGIEKVADIENTVYSRAGILSVDRILQLKYL
jgi:tRNA pseudouridine55 synthase